MDDRLLLEVDDSGCDADDLACCNAYGVRVAADAPWDDFVAETVSREWRGLESLSGLAGSVAEAITANRSVYGTHPGDHVASVRTWDEQTDRQRTFAFADCGFVPGGSVFTDQPRYRILDVTFLFQRGDLTRPLSDPDLLALLGVETGSRVPTTRVRTAIVGD